jgi:hypothetical protein
MLETLTHTAFLLLWVATGLALWSLAIYMSNVSASGAVLFCSHAYMCHSSLHIKGVTDDELE